MLNGLLSLKNCQNAVSMIGKLFEGDSILFL